MGELRYPDPPLADGVVALRPWSRDDLRGAMQFADPVVQRFSWPQARPYTEADAIEYIESRERGRLRGECIEFAIADPADATAVLGCVSLYDFDGEQSRACLGYWLAAPARGRGVATHAARLLASWGFEWLGLARIELTCGPDNLASQRVAERVGFTREGLLRSHIAFKGGRRDTVLFGLLPGELREG